MSTIAQLSGFLQFDTRTDVENDSNPAAMSRVNVQVERVGTAGGFIEFSVVPLNVATLTLTGAPAAGNTVSATIDGHTVTYTVSGTPTLAAVATAVAAAWTADPVAAALATATASGAVVTFTSLSSGQATQFAFSVAQTGGGVLVAASGSYLAPQNPLTGLTNRAACTITVTQP